MHRRRRSYVLEAIVINLLQNILKPRSHRARCVASLIRCMRINWRASTRSVWMFPIFSISLIGRVDARLRTRCERGFISRGGVRYLNLSRGGLGKKWGQGRAWYRGSEAEAVSESACLMQASRANFLYAFRCTWKRTDLPDLHESHMCCRSGAGTAHDAPSLSAGTAC